MRRRLDNNNGITALWSVWLLGAGAFTALLLSSLWLRPMFQTVMAFVLQLSLVYAVQRNRRLDMPRCYLFPYVVSRILFWTGMVMLLLIALHGTKLIYLFLHPRGINPDIPFICTLIVGPVAFFVSGWHVLGKKRPAFCHDCMIRNGTPAERGFLGKIFAVEGPYQLRLLFTLSGVSSLIGWSYYFLMYVNTNFNDPDRLVFLWTPIIIFVGSSIYLALRYMGLLAFYQQNVEGTEARAGRSTTLRYLMVNGEEIAMLPPELDPDALRDANVKFETPVSATLRHSSNVTLPEAVSRFAAITGVQGVGIRFLYSNIRGNADTNIFHYLATPTNEQRAAFDATHPHVMWVTLQQLSKLIDSNLVSPMFVSEIGRLHTVAMAWKTYNRDGSRRYKLKGYIPPFRVSDIPKSEVDFNDPHWLKVSSLNADTQFGWLRKFWQRYVSGVEETRPI